MKILIDFFPILLFFGAFKFYDIYIGTAVLMAATVILIFGTLTLVLHDERFIKWKPTVLYAATAIGLGIAVWVYKKNFLKAMLGSQLSLPEAVWMRLNVIWIGYSVFMAAINGYVAAYFSTEAWVNFKIWGYVFPIAFLVSQGFYISRYLTDDEPAKAGEP